MTFTVTYRGADGALREEAVEAASRAECFAQCKARGIAPVGVREGAQKGGRKNAASPKMATQGGAGRAANVSAAPRGGTWKAAVLAAAVLAAAGGAWWWLAGRDAPDKIPKAPNVTKHNKNLEYSKAFSTPKDITSTIETPSMVPDVCPIAQIASSTVRTNADGTIIEKIVLADGTKKCRVTPPAPIFDNACDQVIALAISTKPGEAMPPLPDLKGIDEDFTRSFLAPVIINDSDPEDIKELKRNVIETKQQLLEAVKGGKSVLEALQDHQMEMSRVEDSRLLAIREMQRIGTEDGMEMAQEFARKVNVDFEAKGIPAIPVIGTQEEKQRRTGK